MSRLGRKSDIEYNTDSMMEMVRNFPLPDIYVEVDGFWYFLGPDGFLWQHDASQSFPDITTQNVAEWCNELLGDDSYDSTLLGRGIRDQNNRAIALLNAKLNKAGM